MKKVLASIFSIAMVLSLSQMAAGQSGSGSLDDQLIQAAANGNTAAVQQLLDKGANIEAKNSVGSTALIMAAFHLKVDVVKLLLDKGASVENKTPKGITPLMTAETLAKIMADQAENTVDKINTSSG